MGGFFNFGLLDVWNHPALKATRMVGKLAAKGIASENAKAENIEITTAELSEIICEAKKGDSNAQCMLALQYLEKRDFKEATYWLEKSAEQDNEHALELLDLLQEE